MRKPIGLIAVWATLSGNVAFADTRLYSANELWDLPLEELMMVQVTTVASGSKTPVSKAASSVTVITRTDIEGMGATDLDQVLETVPGLHVTRSDQAYFSKYIFRGISSAQNPETLLMINSIPVKTLFSGTRSHVWAGMPVKAIERIEVIRGPGSALYGADAFAGVINIITKSGADIQDNKAGMRAGSFDTWGAWTEQQLQLGDVTLGLVAEYEDSNGQHETVDQDAQTLLDSLTGTSASLAPGSVNTGRQATDIRLDLQSTHWQYRLGYQQRDNIGTATGIAQALDPAGLYHSERINTDLTYQRNDLLPHWELQAQLSYYHDTQESIRDSLLFPAGANLGGGVFSDGMIGNPSYWEDQARFDIRTVFRGFDRHILQQGTGFYWGDIYKVTEQKNFDATFTPVPGGLVDVSDTAAAFLRENQRTSYYLYLQDEWRVNDMTALTTGVRYDNYSDFGETTNPRVALVTAWSPATSTRLSYGRAFHAPSFIDLYASNNPVRRGNPDLNPETIDTWELSFHHQLLDNLRYSVTGFTYRIDDAISYVNSVAQNSGERKGRGGEVELAWQLGAALRLVANASYQVSTDALSGAALGDAPSSEYYGRLEWEPLMQWRWHTELLRVGRQPRTAGDNRNALAGYTVMNIALTRRQLWQHLDLMLSIRNLFDARVSEPSPGPSAPFQTAFIPGDFPQAGRTWVAESSWNW